MGFFKKKTESFKVTKLKLLAGLGLGALLLLFDVLTIVFNPTAIFARYAARIDDGSIAYENMKKGFTGVYLSVYLFNVTNGDRFQAGLDNKLKLEEVGPFTYQETRYNEQLEMDHKNNVLRFYPKIVPHFVPEKSIANPEDVVVTMPNVAMLSFGSKMSSSFVGQTAFNLLANQLRSKAIINVTAAQFLWRYEEPLIKVGHTFLPGWIDYDIFGLLDRLYNKKQRYLFEVSTKNEEKFMIKAVNGSGGLDLWGYDDVKRRTICNSFNNSYEGIAYPSDLTPDRTLRLYNSIFCRSIELDFHCITDTEYGTKGFLYKISNRSYTKNEETGCLCSAGICEEGMSDMSPCFLGFSLVLSQAHFLDTDPNVYSHIEGMKPDEKLHGSTFVIDPKVGIAITTKFSVQMNLKLGDVRYNSEISKFSNMVVPVAYFKIEGPRLLDEQQFQLKLLYVIGPSILFTVQIILFLLGLGLVSYSMLLLYWNWHYSKRKDIVLESVKAKMATEPLMR